MIARAKLAIDGAFSRALRQSNACQHVVQSPADVALPHVAPGRPPGKKIVVVRVERAADINEPAAENAFEQLSFVGTLAYQHSVALFWVYVAFRACDIEIAA